MRPRIIALASARGGSGKSSTALNLGLALRRYDVWGKEVLLVDLDPRGPLTAALSRDSGDWGTTQSASSLLTRPCGCELTASPTILDGVQLLSANSDLVGHNLPITASELKGTGLRDLILDQGQRFHHVVVDCPPGLGALTFIAIAIADVVLVPVPLDCPLHSDFRLVERVADLAMEQTGRDLIEVRHVLMKPEDGFLRGTALPLLKMAGLYKQEIVCVAQVEAAVRAIAPQSCLKGTLPWRSAGATLSVAGLPIFSGATEESQHYDLAREIVTPERRRMIKEAMAKWEAELPQRMKELGLT